VCHACAYPDWQAKVLSALQASRWPAFIGELRESPEKRGGPPVRKTKKAPNWTWNVWIGPYQTRDAAVSAVSKLPDVLSSLLREQGQSPTVETELNTGEKVPGFRSGHNVAIRWLGLHWIQLFRLFTDYAVVEN
jgi:hypothetical protein